MMKCKGYKLGCNCPICAYLSAIDDDSGIMTGLWVAENTKGWKTMDDADPYGIVHVEGKVEESEHEEVEGKTWR